MHHRSTLLLLFMLSLSLSLSRADEWDIVRDMGTDLQQKAFLFSVNESIREIAGTILQERVVRQRHQRKSYREVHTVLTYLVLGMMIVSLGGAAIIGCVRWMWPNMFYRRPEATTTDDDDDDDYNVYEAHERFEEVNDQETRIKEITEE